MGQDLLYHVLSDVQVLSIGQSTSYWVQKLKSKNDQPNEFLKTILLKLYIKGAILTRSTQKMSSVQWGLVPRKCP